LQAHSDLKVTLELLSSKLNNATMRRLNGEVNVQKMSVLRAPIHKGSSTFGFTKPMSVTAAKPDEAVMKINERQARPVACFEPAQRSHVGEPDMYRYRFVSLSICLTMPLALTANAATRPVSSALPVSSSATG
jgi:hypothetical protein